MTLSCENRRPCFVKFPNISCVLCMSHALFIIFNRLCYPYLFIFQILLGQNSTTPTIHITSSYHITFCTCSVLILVVMASVSSQAVEVGGGLAGMSLKGGAKKPELAKLSCGNSGADVEWLLDKFNVKLSLVARLGYHHGACTGCV